MKPDGPIKLVCQLLDLPLFDADEQYCGIVDDIELDGAPGKPLKVKALLVGPGAYQGRLPAWAYAIVRMVAGDRITRVPIGEIRTINSAVHLKCAGGKLGLLKSEAAARSWIPHEGAL